MIGVSSGTKSSRGVRTVSSNRRLATVASGYTPARCEDGAAIASSAVDIGALLSGGRGDRVAGEAQVDVVERRLARGDRAREPQLVDRGHRLVRAHVVQRDGQ